jgi:hypothetical protein
MNHHRDTLSAPAEQATGTLDAAIVIPCEQWFAHSSAPSVAFTMADIEAARALLANMVRLTNEEWS